MTSMITDTPRVSIGLPVFNGDRYVREAIESILNQSFGDWELIISDNASTDKTEFLCREMATHDARIRYFKNEFNVGAAKNYNRVFELSRGEYFKWAAHDDVCAPDFIENCVAVLDASADVVLCFSTIVDIDASGKRLHEWDSIPTADLPTPHERFRNLILPGRCHAIFGLMRADTLRRTPLIGSYADCDRVLLSELGLHGRIRTIREPLFFRRRHGESSIQKFPQRRDRTQWFDPSARPTKFPYWKQFVEYLAVIRRSRLSYSQRMRCRWELIRWLRDNRHRLQRDVSAVNWLKRQYRTNSQ